MGRRVQLGHHAGDPDQTTREATTLYDGNQIVVQLHFANGYTGNLHLYAVDFTNNHRAETITVGGQSVDLSSNFSQGAWVSYPLDVAAGGSVTITVTNDGPLNAVLSGLFLGEGNPFSSGGPPPPVNPHGSWVGTYGSQGYDLFAWNDTSSSGDLAQLPSGVTVNVVQASRYQWAVGVSDVRALESPDKSTREATTLYDPNQIELQVHFTNAYDGVLHLYAVDYPGQGRMETITVAGQSTTLSSFYGGAWVAVPVSVSAGGMVTIDVTNNGPWNAVLSGLFFDPPPPLYVGQPTGGSSPAGCAAPSYTTVQAAVNAAAPGQQVYLCGTTPFAEQVVITNQVTLTGDPGASITAPATFSPPATLPPDFTSHRHGRTRS